MSGKAPKTTPEAAPDKRPGFKRGLLDAGNEKRLAEKRAKRAKAEKAAAPAKAEKAPAKAPEASKSDE